MSARLCPECGRVELAKWQQRCHGCRQDRTRETDRKRLAKRHHERLRNRVQHVTPKAKRVIERPDFVLHFAAMKAELERQTTSIGSLFVIGVDPLFLDNRRSRHNP